MVTRSRSRQRSIISVHAEWISLLEVSGPFLSPNVLAAADGFRQGLPLADDENRLRSELRGYYGQWRDDIAKHRPTASLHRLWIKAVMEDVLDWDEVLVERTDLPVSILYTHPETGETTRPDFALFDPDTDKPALLISTYPATQRMKNPVAGSHWAETPAKRMEELLHATDIRLGVVTNGEEWMLVNAPAEETTGFSTWYANLWFEEPVTFTAFRALLGIERLFGVSEEDQLAALLEKSAADQADVTYTLGDQVRQAIELLVAAIDKEDASRNGALLDDVDDETVYEAAVTVMMRLVFLLFAEDQQPPLFGGNDIYDRNYSVSAMIDELEVMESESSIEHLDQKYDGWQRLLAAFRLVYAGSPHDLMRQPAYGGSLFDPDRFPFLEGRQPGSSWETDVASPLPVSNRTVLHILQALQFIQLRGGQGRQRISFRTLDVEQIGHVYEQLLEHTARRSRSNVLGLVGSTRKGISQEPEFEITQLEEWLDRGEQHLVEQLKKPTGKTVVSLKNLLAAKPDEAKLADLLHIAGDDDTYQRILPFANLIRLDRAGKPLVIRPGGLYVTSGSDRATTGSHYTPRSLTEPIVQYALEPLVYDGPADGKPREEWVLHSPKHLLELNICDPAMGSGGFLVQTTRYLADRLLEAWDIAEERLLKQDAHTVLTIASDGTLHTGGGTEHLLPRDKAERLAIARQMVVDHCLYGVDINHLAVDMAKLSLWLITLQRNRPFTFLDHRLRCGDSLLGIHNRDQLLNFSLDGKSRGRGDNMFLNLFREVMADLRSARDKIEAIEVRDVTDSQRQAALLDQADKQTELLRLGADLLVSAQLHPEKKQREPQRASFRDDYSMVVDGYNRINLGAFTEAGKRPTHESHRRLRVEAEKLLDGKRPFHWVLEFPEVCESVGGFSAIVGNPPFLGGSKLTGTFGLAYREFLVDVIADSRRGNSDLAGYFFLQATRLIDRRGYLGMILTNTIAQGDTREVALDRLREREITIIRAVRSEKWPGSAALEVAKIWATREDWIGSKPLDHEPVSGITSYLTAESRISGTPFRLETNRGLFSKGSDVGGKGFVITGDEAEALIQTDEKYRDVVFPYLNGDDVSRRHDQSPSRWVINFHDWSKEKATTYQLAFGIVEERVKPQRMRSNTKANRDWWWRYERGRPDLYRDLSKHKTALVVARVSSNHAFSIIPTGVVFNEMLVVFLPSEITSFGMLQNSFFWDWTRAKTSSMGGKGLRFAASDCFETFPFCQPTSEITMMGDHILNIRTQLMQDSEFGLTNVMNLFNDDTCGYPAIEEMRNLTIRLDESIKESYGWTDLRLDHGFHNTPYGIRFTMSEATRVEVLDRLLELNHQRYAEEQARSEGGKVQRAKIVKQSTMF